MKKGATLGTLEYTEEWVPLSRIKPHPKLQHELRKQWAESIAKQFDPDAFGQPYLVKNGDGYYVIDGMHRCHAARIALGEQQLVFCRVYREEDGHRLAELALRIINRRAWTPIDQFHLRITAGEWQARAINGVLHQFGLRVAAAGDRGVVRAVGACDWIVRKMGLSVLERAVRTLHAAWGDDSDAYDNRLLRGMGLVCARYGEALAGRDLAAALAKSGGPARMIGQARDRAKTNHEEVPRAAAEILRNEYNKRRRNRLPPLDT